MKLSYVGLLLPVLAGCSSWTSPSETELGEMDNSGSTELYQPVRASAYQAEQRSAARSKNINHYVRSIMQDLANNLQYVNQKTPLAVTSFVFLDGDYTQASLVGNQLAEGFIYELHKFGIPVVDFKTTDYVRVTEQGDFIFSRDYLELSQNHNFNYVLGGTLVHHQGGILVNARIVGVKSKAVVGSAQGFIPQSVVDALHGEGQHDGVMLKQAAR